MDHQPPTFTKFPFLPIELRALVFEQALLPLIEPRIIAVKKVIDWPEPFWPFRLIVTNGPLLHANDSFVTSAATLQQVCKESHRVVRSFFRRFGEPGPQPAADDRRGYRFLSEFALRPPLRPVGTHADIFLWHGHGSHSILLEDPEDPSFGYRETDMQCCKRWLVPIHILIGDVDRMQVEQDFVHRQAMLNSPTDIIALISDPNDGLESLKYNHLTIVSADASRDMVIPGLDPGKRNSILERFEIERHELREFEREHREATAGIPGMPPERVYPDLYFAYVDPLKRGEPPKLIPK